VTDQHVEIVKLAIQAVVAIALVAAMTWIVLSPTATDEASKAALVVVSSAMGFLFGKHSS
jgi:hypothetical protein